MLSLGFRRTFPYKRYGVSRRPEIACGSFVVAKHDVIPDLNGTYILVPQTKMDLRDFSEFLSVIQGTGTPEGLQPTPCFFPLLFTRSRATSASPLQITNFPFVQPLSSGDFLPSLFLDRDFRFDPFTDLGWVPKTSSDVSLHI